MQCKQCNKFRRLQYEITQFGFIFVQMEWLLAFRVLYRPPQKTTPKGVVFLFSKLIKHVSALIYSDLRKMVRNSTRQNDVYLISAQDGSIQENRTKNKI